MSYKFFENKKCEFYPCHKAERLNCLFCFCPLYEMDCEGDYKMVSLKSGEMVKDCSECVLPHGEKGYDYVIEHLKRKKEGFR